MLRRCIMSATTATRQARELEEIPIPVSWYEQKRHPNLCLVDRFRVGHPTAGRVLDDDVVISKSQSDGKKTVVKLCSGYNVLHNNKINPSQAAGPWTEVIHGTQKSSNLRYQISLSHPMSVFFQLFSTPIGVRLSETGEKQEVNRQLFTANHDIGSSVVAS